MIFQPDLEYPTRSPDVQKSHQSVLRYILTSFSHDIFMMLSYFFHTGFLLTHLRRQEGGMTQYDADQTAQSVAEDVAGDSGMSGTEAPLEVSEFSGRCIHV